MSIHSPRAPVRVNLLSRTASRANSAAMPAASPKDGQEGEERHSYTRAHSSISVCICGETTSSEAAADGARRESAALTHDKIFVNISPLPFFCHCR